MNNLCTGALCTLLLALASPASAQSGDGDKITAAMRAGMQAGRCGPPQSMLGGKLRYDLVFAAMGGDLLLCAMHDQHTRGYELAGCWQSGTAAKPFAPHPTRLVPGYSVADDATGVPDAKKTAGATCLRAAREARRAFRKPVAYEYQGLRHEIADSGSRRSVITRDAKSGAVVQTRALPVCAVPRD